MKTSAEVDGGGGTVGEASVTSEALPLLLCSTDPVLGTPKPIRLWRDRFGDPLPSATLWDGFEGDSAALARSAATEELKRREPFSVEVAAGSAKQLRWYRLEFAPAKDSRRRLTGWWIVAHESSARHQMESRLRASEERYREWIETIDDVYFSTSLDVARVFDISESYGRISGSSPDELRKNPRDWLTRVVAEDRPKLEATIAQLRSGRVDRAVVECRLIRRSDGAMRTASYLARRITDATGEARKIVWVVTDISERKAIETALRNSEERFQMAAAASSDGQFDWDITRNQVYYSPRWKEMLGYLDHEISPHLSEWRERFHPGDRIRALQYMGDFLAGRIATFQLEARLLHKDGSYRWILSRGIPVRDASGRPVRIVGSTTDLTSPKDLQRRVLEASEHERRMIGFDLHDGLGQELTAVEMMCQMLLSRLGTSEPTVTKVLGEMSKLIKNSVAHVRTISRGLAPATLAAYGLSDSLNDLAHISADASGISCRFLGAEVGDNLDRLVATQLYRIAQEAVNNALKHSRAKRIEIDLRQDAEKLVLVVEDNGCGLNRTPDSPRRGHGLEVMLYRAKLIGAHLDLDVGPLGGTRVTCTLA